MWRPTAACRGARRRSRCSCCCRRQSTRGIRSRPQSAIRRGTRNRRPTHASAAAAPRCGADAHADAAPTPAPSVRQLAVVAAVARSRSPGRPPARSPRRTQLCQPSENIRPPLNRMPRIGTTRHQRAAERTRLVGVGVAHDPHRGADDDEGEQRADVDHLGQRVDREQRRHHAPPAAPVRIVALCGVRKRGWTVPKNEYGQQPVARHGEEDARLAEHQHQQHAGDAGDGAERDDEHGDRRARSARTPPPAAR